MEMANKGRKFAKGCAIAVVVFAVVAEVALSCISLCARLHRSSGVKALWYQKLADCGVVFAQYKVAMMYQEGVGVQKDPAKAVEWLRKAARRDHILAQNRLGLAYEYGFGVEKNYGKAKWWYRKAANRGYARA